VTLAGAAVVLAVISAGCIDRGYPLGSSGGVEVRLDTSSAIFAADVVDANGVGVLPRQTPYQTGVTLTLTDGNQAANGAYVDVRVEPAEALAIAPDEKENAATRTCKAKDGKFRCVASPEGIARFVLTAVADWSGEAKLVVTWADQHKDVLIDVLPAGLPASAKDFQIVATGLADSNRVLPTYSALACTTIDSLPSDLGSKWRPGNVRSRQAFVRASAPADQPGIVANAPVVIESLDSEAALSLDAACDDKSRVTRLRVLLGDTGESPPFFLCFSDIGGKAEYAVSSGALSIAPNPSLLVDAEPRVLRVAALSETVAPGDTGPLFELSAFNTDLQRIAMPVDLASSDPSVLKLPAASLTLSPEGSDPTSVIVTPASPGSAVLHVRPRLFKNPDCASVPITVTAAP
jgi:hypothetical protein